MEHTVSEKLFGQIRDCTKLALRLAHSEYRFFDPEAMGGGIGRGQGLVLRILAENDGLTQSELAERLDIRPSSLGELVSKLAESGYVERRQNENDKRIFNVFLTEKGREAEKAFINPRQRAAESWCAEMSESEQAQLSELLGKLIGSMESALSKNEEEFAGRDMPFGHGCHGMGGGNGMRHGPHFRHHENFGGEYGCREGMDGFWF